MKAIAPRNVVTMDLIDISVLLYLDGRTLTVDVMQRNFAAFETQICKVRQTSGDQILHDLVLTIDGYELAGEFFERNAMTNAIQTQLDSAMVKTFTVEAFTHAGVV